MICIGIFGDGNSAKYWDFNFADYHILGQQVNNEWIWQKRENKKAFFEIPSTAQFGWVGSKPGRLSFFMILSCVVQMTARDGTQRDAAIVLLVLNIPLSGINIMLW